MTNENAPTQSGEQISRPKTGADDLDRDLDLLFKIVSGDKLDEYKRRINKRIDDYLPSGFISLLGILLDEENFTKLIEHVGEKSRPSLEQARTIAETHFPQLRDLLPELTDIFDASGDDEAAKDDPRSVITGLSWVPQWVGGGDKLIPMSRVSFRGRNEKILLTSTLDIDDLSFLLRSIAKILSKTLEESIPLAEHGQVSITEGKKLHDSVGEAKKYLAQIEEAAKQLGIEPSVSEVDTSVDSSSATRE